MINTTKKSYVFGMIGLGTMGRNLLLNMADHGFKVTGYDKNVAQVALLNQEGKSSQTVAFDDLKSFVESLQTPRAIMMLVPAGPIVDQVIADLIPLLQAEDIIIDGGNSHFTDTENRVTFLKEKQIHFFGMGISGGEKGARFGPSMMPGGDKTAYLIMKPILDAVAAKVNGEPCVAYIGPGASGHFVKMVHNGIEYAMMQLISECYGFMKTGLSLKDDEIDAVFDDWNKSRLHSYLLDITTDIFKFKEVGASHLLVNDIKDEALAKGTGKWTSQAAMDIQTPITTIDSAVAIRDLSKFKALRVQANALYDDAKPTQTNTKETLKDLEDALYFGMMITYAQGMHLLATASESYHYDLDLAEIAKIWRGGCIIRANFLENILEAYQQNPLLPHLLLQPQIVDLVKITQNSTRKILTNAIANEIGLPTFTAALSYFDCFKTGNMPSNLIQAQRDYFGAHTYQRIDKEGIFHTQWN